MPFSLAPLPFSREALSPHISAETLDYHHGKHHAGYVRKVNAIVAATPSLEGATLEALVLASSGPLYNAAAQAWNHDFYWKSLTPEAISGPQADLAAAILRDFGSLRALHDLLIESATGVFGSGWCWLVADATGRLSVETTSNADNPLRRGGTPLLVWDVWEHAYYVDYRNDRRAYLAGCWVLTNWDFASANYTACNRS